MSIEVETRKRDLLFRIKKLFARAVGMSGVRVFPASTWARPNTHFYWHTPQVLHHLVRWASTLFACTGEAHTSIAMGDIIKQGGKAYSCLKRNKFKIRCWDRVGSIVTRLRAGRSGVRIPAKARHVSSQERAESPYCRYKCNGKNVKEQALGYFEALFTYLTGGNE
jgi:hypothetical protein